MCKQKVLDFQALPPVVKAPVVKSIGINHIRISACIV
jgi:hypothetical protein